MVRTSGLAIPASYTTRVDLANNPCMVIYLRGSGGADRDAGRVMMAMHAWPGKIRDLRIREGFAIGYFKKLHPGDAALLVGFISPDAHIVFSGTGNHACATTGAFVQIDDHTILVFTLFLFHSLPRSKKLMNGRYAFIIRT